MGTPPPGVPPRGQIRPKVLGSGYPIFAEKAAVLCSRLIRNHPLLDGNKRVGYICLLEFIERNGYSWSPPPGDTPDGDETVDVIEKVAARKIDEPTLARWI